MKKAALLSIIVLFLFSCANDKHELKWKIQHDDQVNYELCTQIINDSTTFPKGGLYDEMIGEAYMEMRKNSNYKDALMYDFWHELRIRQVANLDIICESFLVYSFRDNIYFQFNPNQKQKFDKTEGELLDNGKISVKNENPGYYFLYNILLELPKNKIAIGDEWNLNIKGFETDKAKNDPMVKNKVSFNDIILRSHSQSAVIEFDISSGDMNSGTSKFDFDFTGTGSFNIEKGYWEKLQGFITYRSTGLLKINMVQEIYLQLTEGENIKNNTNKDAVKTEQNLSGIYGGINWKLESGRAIINPIDTNEFILEFYNIKLDEPCGVADGNKIISTTCPRKVGLYKFEDSKFRSVFFDTDSNELKTDYGSIELVTIDTEEMKLNGKLQTWYNENHQVKGDFTIKLCKDFFYDEPIIFQYNTYFDRTQKFKIQILASKSKISLRNKMFRKLKYKVNETYIKEEPVYKYKYRIGAGNLIDKALEIKTYARNNGFSDAFLVKVGK